MGVYVSHNNYWIVSFQTSLGTTTYIMSLVCVVTVDVLMGVN